MVKVAEVSLETSKELSVLELEVSQDNCGTLVSQSVPPKTEVNVHVLNKPHAQADNGLMQSARPENEMDGNVHVFNEAPPNEALRGKPLTLSPEFKQAVCVQAVCVQVCAPYIVKDLTVIQGSLSRRQTIAGTMCVHVQVCLVCQTGALSRLTSEEDSVGHYCTMYNSGAVMEQFV